MHARWPTDATQETYAELGICQCYKAANWHVVRGRYAATNFYGFDELVGTCAYGDLCQLATWRVRCADQKGSRDCASRSPVSQLAHESMRAAREQLEQMAGVMPTRIALPGPIGQLATTLAG